MSENAVKTARLEGIDLARFIAFVGMVLVNFRIILAGAEAKGPIVTFLEGKAAALFVVLAGIGLGLAAKASKLSIATTLKRAVFLMVIGLANMLIFPADIIHFYAIYFAIGVAMISWSSKALWGAMIGISLLSAAAVVLLPFDAGWDWANFHVKPDEEGAEPFTFMILFLWTKEEGEWISKGDFYVTGKFESES